MASTVDLYVNTGVDQGALVTPSLGAIGKPVFTLYDIVNMTIQLRKPNPSAGRTASTIENISAMSMQFEVGSLTGPTAYVTQFTWTKDLANNIFTAQVAFNTAALIAALGSATSIDAVMAMTVTEGTAIRSILSTAVTIREALIVGTAGSVAAGQTPISAEQAAATYVPFIGTAGQTITLTSPDGTHQVVIGCNNDGTVKMDIV